MNILMSCDGLHTSCMAQEWCQASTAEEWHARPSTRIRQAQLASSCTVLRWPHSVWTISWQTRVQQADQRVPGTNILDMAGWLIESKHGTRCQAVEQ